MTESTNLYYMLYDMPWPIENHQSITYTVVTFEGEKVIFYTKPGKGNIEKDEDAIWMNDFFERWEITHKPDNTVNVNVTGKLNLNGSIPSWLVSSFIPAELKKAYEGIIKRTIQ